MQPKELVQWLIKDIPNTSRYNKALKSTTLNQKIPSTLDFIWLIPSILQSNKSHRWINIPRLKTNSLIEKTRHPHPRYSFINPATSSGFYKAHFGGSSVAQFPCNRNLQSLQKDMETPATCIASTLGNMQKLTDVVSMSLLTKLSMIYGLQVPAKAMANETTRNLDVSFLKRLSMGRIVAHRRLMIKTTNFLIIDLQD